MPGRLGLAELSDLCSSALRKLDWKLELACRSTTFLASFLVLDCILTSSQ